MFQNKILLALCSFLLLGFLGLTPVNASPGIVPANPDPNNPRTQSIFIYKTDLGKTFKDQVKVVNNDKETKTFLVYATDSVVSSGGAFGCAQRNEERTEIGSWVLFSTNEVEVPALSSKTVDFTVSVPASANAGENNGCIVIEEKKAAPVVNSSGALLSFRTAARVLAQLPGEVKKELEITNFSQVELEKVRNIQAAVKNNGNVSVDADINVTLKDMFGKVVKTYGGTYPVLRNTTLELNFAVDDPNLVGFYTAEMTVKYNGDVNAGTGVKYDDSNVKILTANSFNIFISPNPGTMAILGLSCLALVILIVIIVLFIIKKRKKGNNKDTKKKRL